MSMLRESRNSGIPLAQERRLEATSGTLASRLPVSTVTLIAAAGVLVASVAFAAGRLGYDDSPWANRTYWIGQALILIPITGRLLSRRSLTSGATVTLVVVLTVAEYLLKVCYSPLGFTFADELLHWRGTTNLLQTASPFTLNYGLPIGTHYPGLEEATAALMSCTGLSLFPAGLIVSGLAHLLFICALYSIFQACTRSYRIAGIAVLLYFCTPALTSFNSMFVYETLALAFFGLGMLAALKSATERSRKDRTGWFVLATFAIMATVVTHHVTSYVLTGVLILVTVASVFTRSRNTTAKLGALAFISLIAVASWIGFVARDTISYFSPTVHGVAQGLNKLQSGGSSHAPSTSLSPLGNQLLEAVGILLVSVLLLLGCWRAWLRYRHHPWIMAMILGSIGWFVDLAVRVATPDGQELAGRTATYVYIPVCVIIAFAFTLLVNSPSMRRWKSATITFVAVGVVTLLFDGLANGWPPYWERLPGPHLVSGFERSIGPEEIVTGNWTLSALGKGNRFAADAGIYPVLAGYGDQDPLQDIAYLYTSSVLSVPIADHAQAQGVHYVVVDERLSQSLPASGYYFMGDTSVYTHPIPEANLIKFNDVRGVARLYDSGKIVIYNLQGLGYVPHQS